MNLKDLTIAEYTAKVNTDKPLATAGPTLALCGAFGLSLLGLAAKVTLKKYPEENLKSFVDDLDKLFDEILNLGETDLNNFLAVLKREKGTLEKSIQVPLKLADLSVKIYEDFRSLLEKCSSPVKEDAAAGMLLLKTCSQGSLNLAKENIRLLDKENQKYYYKKMRTIEHRIKTTDQKNL